jgi:hypothetical protein
MFRALSKLFCKEEPPKVPFIDQELGTFTFERNLGWKTQIELGGKKAVLTLGSDGEPPTQAMLQTARLWLDQWSSQHTQIIEYIRQELADWSGEPDLPVAEKLEVESINILWSDKPRTSMVYFHYPGDDIRCWHVSFDGFEPYGLAYDD